MARINDDKLKNGAASYVRQISEQCANEGGSDIACIVILARPTGDGEFSVIEGAMLDGQPIAGPVKRKIYAHLHNEASVLLAPPQIRGKVRS